MNRMRPHAIGLNLDPLVDMMSQGVGILIVVMAVAQLATGDAMRRIKAAGELPEVSSEDLETAREEKQKLDKLLVQLRRQWNLDRHVSETSAHTELSRLKRLIAELNHLLRLPREETDKDGLSAIVKEQRSRLNQLRADIAAARERFTSFEAELAGLIANRPTPKELRVPANRQAPSGLEPKLFVCRNGRVFPRNDAKLVERMNEAVTDALHGRNVTVDDIPSVERYFEENHIGDEYLRLKLKYQEGLAFSGGSLVKTYSPVLEMLPREQDQGDTIDQLHAADSVFLRSLGEEPCEEEFLRFGRSYPNANAHYVRFLVWADSFDAYLAARKLSDQRGFYAGWFPFSSDHEFQVPLTQTGAESSLGEIDNFSGS